MAIIFVWRIGMFLHLNRQGKCQKGDTKLAQCNDPLGHRFSVLCLYDNDILGSCRCGGSGTVRCLYLSRKIFLWVEFSDSSKKKCGCGALFNGQGLSSVGPSTYILAHLTTGQFWTSFGHFVLWELLQINIWWKTPKNPNFEGKDKKRWHT